MLYIPGKVMNLRKILPQFRNLAVTYCNPQQYVNSRIKVSKNVKHLELVKSLFIKTGLIDHRHAVSELIGQCFDLGRVEFALSVFDISKNRSLLVQNSLTKRLCKLGLWQDVISVYKTCVNSGCRSTEHTFPLVIKACSGLCDVGLGREVHCAVLRNGCGCNVVVQTAVVDFYAKIGRIDVARKVFDEMVEFDVVACNALISGYCFNGFDYEALDIFRAVWVNGLKANVLTLTSIFSVCARLGFRNLGGSLHGYAVKSGFDQDEFLIPALISLYINNGDVNVAERLFDLSPVNNEAIWGSMICAYTQNQYPEQAFEMFYRMICAGLRPNAITFRSVISCCEKMNSLLHGECLHGCVIKYGLENQVSVAPTLINMYSKLGDIHSARHLFNQMSHKNLLTWNSLISGFLKQGLFHESLEAVREMKMAGFESDSISMINVLSACSELQAFLLGKSAHGISMRKGFDSNLNLSNLLLAFYSNCDQLESSFKLFPRIPQKDSVSWNTMISICVNHGEKSKAEFFLSEMQKEGLKIDVISLISILPIFDEPNKLSQGMTLHGYSIKFGLFSDITLGNALISMYSDCNSLNEAELIFRTMRRRCLISWNSLITGYRCHNLHKEALTFFKVMINHGEKPNYITLLNVLPGCCNLLQGKSAHSYAIKTRNILQNILVNSLILMYSRLNNLKYCHLLFEAGDKFDICLWNVMLSSLLEAKAPEKAFALFSELLQSDLKVDCVTVLSLISVCGHLNSVNLSNSIFGFAIRNGFSNETSICNALTDIYAKNGDIMMARSVFDSLMYKDTVSWSILIHGYGLNGYGHQAFSCLSQMENSGIKPDHITYLNLLSACNHSGLSEKSKIIFNSMIDCGMQPKMEHYASVVDLLVRKGDLQEAYDFISKMPDGPSVTILESLLGACRVYGNVEIGEKVGELIIQKDPENAAVFVKLYNLYDGVGRWDDAMRVRGVMEEKALRKVTAFSMVDGNGG